MVKQVKAGNRLIVLLICPGSPGDGIFWLHITTKPNDIKSEAFITKFALEFVLKYWLGPACQPFLDPLMCCEFNQLANTLSESGSGHFRGSAFTTRALAQVAQEHGFWYPLPRAHPRSAPQGQLFPLPLSPPANSFLRHSYHHHTPIGHFFASCGRQRFLTEGAENIFLSLWSVINSNMDQCSPDPV